MRYLCCPADKDADVGLWLLNLGIGADAFWKLWFFGQAITAFSA